MFSQHGTKHLTVAVGSMRLQCEVKLCVNPGCLGIGVVGAQRKNPRYLISFIQEMLHLCKGRWSIGQSARSTSSTGSKYVNGVCTILSV